MCSSKPINDGDDELLKQLPVSVILSVVHARNLGAEYQVDCHWSGKIELRVFGVPASELSSFRRVGFRNDEIHKALIFAKNI